MLTVHCELCCCCLYVFNLYCKLQNTRKIYFRFLTKGESAQEKGKHSRNLKNQIAVRYLYWQGKSCLNYSYSLNYQWFYFLLLTFLGKMLKLKSPSLGYVSCANFNWSQFFFFFCSLLDFVTLPGFFFSWKYRSQIVQPQNVSWFVPSMTRIDENLKFHSSLAFVKSYVWRMSCIECIKKLI